MKTVVIWDSCEADIKYFVVDRDVTHLNRKYVNSSDNSEEEDAEVSMLAYGSFGQPTIEMLAEFPIQAVKEGAAVIVCGFLP
jgi:hypothetical protein